MRPLAVRLALAFVFLHVVPTAPSRAAGRSDAVVGNWAVAVDYPGGSLRLDLVIAEKDGRLHGKLALLDDTLLVTKIDFEPPRLSAEVQIGERRLEARGMLDGGKLSGQWSIVGGDSRGTWTAERKAATQRRPVEQVLGVWPVSLYLPNGVLHLTLALEQSAGRLVGSLAGEAGTVGLQALDFDGEVLRFEVHLMGESYRFESALKDGKLVGRWLAGGSWSSPGKKRSSAGGR